jgi:trimethylamine--corrinoid protein Co-methyltransferase
MEVWDQREIDLFVEMGTVVRGSLEAYYSEPCLVTAKETISPLYLDGNSGDILLALARRQLPCTIIPMPITGMSAPVSMLGSLVIGNAEILGVMSAIKAAVPDALVGGGSISGLLDMRSGTASFGAPEAILQDIALAEVHEKLYGFNYLIGAGYTDAKLPNSQTLVEKTLKFLLTCLARRHTYPVGLINGGSVFSAEQALVDLEICRNIHAQLRPIGGFEAIEEIVDLIDRAGIRGHFLETEHTRVRFRENWLPELLDRSGFASIEHSRSRELYRAAHEQAGQLLGRGDFWQIEREKARAIDEIVARARRIL